MDIDGILRRHVVLQKGWPFWRSSALDAKHLTLISARVHPTGGVPRKLGSDLSTGVALPSRLTRIRSLTPTNHVRLAVPAAQSPRGTAVIAGLTRPRQRASLDGTTHHLRRVSAFGEGLALPLGGRCQRVCRRRCRGVLRVLRLTPGSRRHSWCTGAAGSRCDP